MPSVLNAASAVVQFTMEDADDNAAVGEPTIDEDTGIETMVIALQGGARKKVTMNTFAVQQRTQVYVAV